MSEPTYRVKPIEAFVNGWAVEHADGRCAVLCVTQKAAERIASLLTQDDARIAREGHRDRLLAEPERLGIAHWLGGPPALIAWGEAQQWQRPLADLDRLEAAYRAAQEQG